MMMRRLCLSALLIWTPSFMNQSAMIFANAQADMDDRQPHLFDIAQLTDSAVLRRCRNDLLEIDENEDLRLDRDEYVAFLQLQSGNQMSGEAADVPLRLESIYHSNACWCDVVDPTDDQCCLGGKDHIPLDTTQSDLIEPYLQFFCSSIENGLEAEGLAQPPLLTGMPTFSPTSVAPTPEPTVAPSISPSLEPTTEPSGAPTSAPTVSPTEESSSSPTIILSTIAPTTAPTMAPTTAPTNVTTSAPTQSPTEPQPETLCVDFQYTVRNSAGHDAQSLLSASDNTILEDLLLGTTNIMTEILSGTYPPQSLRRQLLQELGRQLAFFSEDYPVAINSVTDKADCEGSDVNPDVLCAMVASTVCAVLEEGDDPAEVRSTMVSGLQYAVESGDFPEQEDLPPTQAPTPTPLPTLCVDFQYVVRNQVGLDADAIWNEEGNNVLQGLELSTRNITIDILNGTYPPARRLDDTQNTPRGSNLRYASGESQMVVHTFSAKGSERRLRQRSAIGRRLAYYSDDYPVSINSVTDNPLCEGQAENANIKCSIISSTVCVVLEDGDEPSEVRAFMIAGLREAVQTGEFLRRIPPADLS